MRKIIFASVVLFFWFVAQASAVEFSAEMKTSVMGMTTTSKIYHVNYKKERVEMMGMIFITGDPVSYQLFEDTKRYAVIDEEEMKQNNPMADVDSFEDYIKKNDMRKTGTESVGEYKCDVYEGNVQYAEDQPATAVKFWYSPKLEYVLKTEAQLPAPMSGTSISTLENINIAKQPAGLFEIPDGYTQAQSAQDAMGMGGFAMPSGDESSEMPSQEDMGKMMEMMQEMMGGSQE